MVATTKQAGVDFYTYPPIGGDDWRYAFATGKIRALETQMLSRATLLDVANAADFAQAAEMVSATEYALEPGAADFGQVEQMLRQRRSDLRRLFEQLILDEPLLELVKQRDDFANMRLALRRRLTDRPLGTDYSNEGSIGAERYEQIFEQEDYSPLPPHMQKSMEPAVLAYYRDKDIRQIDYALDAAQAEYEIGKAIELKSIFLEGLFRIQVDLTNIRTLLRLKFTESELTDAFIDGGYLKPEMLRHCLDVADEAIARAFFVTPYYELVESGVSYLASDKSFLKLEANCDNYMTGFLKLTAQITAGPQPVIAYLLMKEQEIRTIRLILTGKKNNVESRLILDRLGE